MTSLLTGVKAQLLCVDHNLTFSFQFNPSSLKLGRSVNWNGSSPARKKTAKKGDEAEAEDNTDDDNDGELGAAWPALTSAKGDLDELEFDTLFDESEKHEMSQLSASSLASSFASMVPGLSVALAMTSANTKSVVANIEALYQMTLPVQFDTKGQEVRPPVLSFVWGDFRFTGVLKSVDFEIIQFDLDGNAKRAKVSCKMQGRFGKATLRQKVLEAPKLEDYGKAIKPTSASPAGEMILA